MRDLQICPGAYASQVNLLCLSECSYLKSADQVLHLLLFIPKHNKLSSSHLDFGDCIIEITYTVEPPNKGQVGAWALVHYSGLHFIGFFLVKKPFLCVVSNILLVYKLLWSVLEQQ